MRLCKPPLQAKVCASKAASIFIFLLLFLFLAAGVSPCMAGGVLDPHGPVGNAERLILINATEIMLVVVIPVIVLALGFAWWFRASNTRAVYDPDFSYSGQIELVVWSIPAMIVILLAGVAWIGSHQLDPAEHIKAPEGVKPVRVEVVSLDWKWLFFYPDYGLATVNDLTIPAGAPVEFTLTSATVMNAFFIPQLGSQIYTMPGMTTHLNLMADRPGDYPGLSSHFSGQGFSDMRFVTHALPASGFETWANQARASSPPLDADAYAALSKPAISTPLTFVNTDTGFFDRIVEQSAPNSGMQAPSIMKMDGH